MKSPLFFKMIFIGVLSLVLSACQSTGMHIMPTPTLSKLTAIKHPQWKLTQGSIDQHTLNLAYGEITLEITPESEFSGNSGINQYRVAVQQQGSQLVVSDGVHTTRMMGSVEEMRLESEYLSALRRITHSTEKDGTLQLSGEGVELLFKAM